MRRAGCRREVNARTHLCPLLEYPVRARRSGGCSATPECSSNSPSRCRSELLLKIELPNEEVAQRLMIAAAANGLKPPPSIQRYVDPTPKELAAAPLLLLRAGGPGTERGHPRDGTSYDDSHACPQCGAGLVQTSPFRVRKTELPKSFLATGVADDLLLHESVAEIVASAGMRGMTLRPVLDHPARRFRGSRSSSRRQCRRCSPAHAA